MSEQQFCALTHDEAVSLFVLLREQEYDLEERLQLVLRKLEQSLFSVHSIEEMETLSRRSTDTVAPE
jgi:hypothetical protein